MNIFAKLTDLPDNAPLEQIKSDFMKRFQGTVLWDNKNNIPILVQRFNDNGLLTCYTDNGSENISLYTKESDLSVYLPDVGYYMLGGRPFYLYKRPRRQFTRSFHGHIYALHPSYSILHIIKEILHSKFTNLNNLKKPDYCILSRFFALKPYNDKEGTLFYRDFNLGQLDFNKKTIKLDYPIYLQEVQDLLYRTGATRWTIL